MFNIPSKLKDFLHLRKRKNVTGYVQIHSYPWNGFMGLQS